VLDPDHASRPTSAEELWRHQLTVGTGLRWKRILRNRIPSNPRCTMCAAPFGGIGGLIMPFFGHARWAKNPRYCAGCYAYLRANHGGAEVECSLLFADVRGSTGIAERMAPMQFTRLMGRFFDSAAPILVNEGALVDKFVGDEVIGIFIPAMATARHGEHAIRAARAILRATGNEAGKEPWVPVGIGVSTGVAYVGSVGEGMDTEMTAMGDLVNTTARLSSSAAAGEILVLIETARAAGLSLDAIERRTLELRGKAEPTEVAVLTAGPARDH
jgi:adenylate cyclase